MLFRSPFKITATVLLTAVLLTVGILNLRDRAEWVDPTDGVYWVDGDLGLVARRKCRRLVRGARPEFGPVTGCFR